MMTPKALLLTIMAMASLFCEAQNDNTRQSPLYGKTINIIGDSYVANHRRPKEETWHSMVASKYSMTYRNYGRNGCCIAFNRDKDGFGPSLLDKYRMMNDTADYVIVLAGHNDAEKIKDSEDSLSIFRNRLEALCDSLIEKFPDAKLAFITPWNVQRPGFRQVIATIEEVCAERSIPVFNAAKESGIYVGNEKFRKRYFQSPNDTAHLNAKGHQLVMNKMESFLLRL